jgi:hypothetical protein
MVQNKWDMAAVNGLDYIVGKGRNTCVVIHGREGSGIDSMGQGGEVRVGLDW